MFLHCVLRSGTSVTTRPRPQSPTVVTRSSSLTSLGNAHPAHPQRSQIALYSNQRKGTGWRDLPDGLRSVYTSRSTVSCGDFPSRFVCQTFPFGPVCEWIFEWCSIVSMLMDFFLFFSCADFCHVSVSNNHTLNLDGVVVKFGEYIFL